MSSSCCSSRQLDFSGLLPPFPHPSLRLRGHRGSEGLWGPPFIAPLRSHLDSEALRSRRCHRVMKTVVPPPARVPRRQQQVRGAASAGIILAQWGRCLGEQVLAL